MRRGILRKLSTLRHGRGFGVHSPLAYELIAAVLPDRPAYYADRTIKTLYTNKRQRRMARVVVRLVARFQPHAAVAPEFLRPAIKLADSKICFIDNTLPADMTIHQEGKILTIKLGSESENHGPLILDNERDMRIVIFRKGLSPTLVNTTI